ncbi:MAG: hypothetical protein ABMB14_14465 [Myxococcota bacterium]
MIAWLAGAGLASVSWDGDYDLGFAVESRDDAPTDGMLLYTTNRLYPATGTDQDGVTVPLEVVRVTGIWDVPQIGIRPPPGGWGADASWTVTVVGQGDARTALPFTTGADPAPPPAAEIGPPEIGSWSDEPGGYLYGCCERTREVTIPVSAPDADPWSWIELVALFPPTTDPDDAIDDHLTTVIGPGTHPLTLVQWDEDGVVQPTCGAVVPVSASGARGTAVTFCAADPPGPAGCTTGAGRGGLGIGPALVAAAALRAGRRRRR